MKRGLAMAVLSGVLCLACSPKPFRSFLFGVRWPLDARDEAAAQRLGIPVLPALPPGAVMESASENGAMAGWGRLRLLAARAVVEGRTGIVFVLPQAPSGRALVDYPEEWQALARVAREFGDMRPILERGEEVSPAPAPPGLKAKAWRFSSRRYDLLANVSNVPVRIEEVSFLGRRALFEARADPSESLTPCSGGMCLAPGKVLWLEGRPYSSGGLE